MRSKLTLPLQPGLLLKPQETADICRVAVDTLKRWRAQEAGPKHIVIGKRSVRYPSENINKVFGY